MKYQHTAVWIDHQRATVMNLALLAPPVAGDRPHDLASLGAEASVVRSAATDRKLHRKSGERGDGRAPVDHEFFEQVVAQVGEAGEVLIVGPGSAKTEFSHHLERRHPRLAQHVVGVETVDHPSDRELLDLARREFRRIDSLRGTAR